MECIIIRELVELAIGATVLGAFFSKKFPLMYKSPFALIVGPFFLVEPLADILTGEMSNLLELLGALTLLTMVEKFIATNNKSAFNIYPVFLSIAFSLFVIGLGGGIKYLHVGTLVTFGVIIFRTGTVAKVIKWPHREVFLISSLFVFPSVVAFLEGFIVLSDFLYFGSVFLFMLGIVEVVGSAS